jgi:hypothetical protein
MFDAGYLVGRGAIATVEIGVEVKILAKAMIKQIARVMNDLRNQVIQFRRGGGHPICVAIIGVNQAESTVGYEGDRRHRRPAKPDFYTQFRKLPRPSAGCVPSPHQTYDEFLILQFKATNSAPYPFEWAYYNEIRLDYAAALSRISARYQQRF